MIKTSTEECQMPLVISSCSFSISVCVLQPQSQAVNWFAIQWLSPLSGYGFKSSLVSEGFS